LHNHYCTGNSLLPAMFASRLHSELITVPPRNSYTPPAAAHEHNTELISHAAALTIQPPSLLSQQQHCQLTTHYCITTSNPLYCFVRSQTVMMLYWSRRHVTTVTRCFNSRQVRPLSPPGAGREQTYNHKNARVSNHAGVKPRMKNKNQSTQGRHALNNSGSITTQP
jgi:hypothetical protein